MIRINKRTEPKEWTAKKKTPDFKFATIPELRKSLLEEQGHICGFCMRRIPAQDPPRGASSIVAHLLPQSPKGFDQEKATENEKKQLRKQSLDYNNMVLSCPGLLDRDEQHCDNSQGNEVITIDLFSHAIESSVRYKIQDKMLEIYSTNIAWDYEINDKNKLNLNCTKLKDARFRALRGLRRSVELTNSKGKTINWKKRYKKLKVFNDNGQLQPFCGVLIWWTAKKIKRN